MLLILYHILLEEVYSKSRCSYLLAYSAHLNLYIGFFYFIVFFVSFKLDNRHYNFLWHSSTVDISADLEELGQTPVMVVCAGAKSILDLGLTLEYLETKGVPVIGYGTSELPAFYTRKSGFGVDYELDTPEELAAAFHAERELGMKNGMLVTNPIPEKYSMDHKVIDKAIEQALAEAKAQGIHGKETTPFLLAKVKDLTGGDSLESNIQLVYNNAVLGAKTACALAALKD